MKKIDFRNCYLMPEKKDIILASELMKRWKTNFLGIIRTGLQAYSIKRQVQNRYLMSEDACKRARKKLPDYKQNSSFYEKVAIEILPVSQEESDDAFYFLPDVLKFEKNSPELISYAPTKKEQSNNKTNKKQNLAITNEELLDTFLNKTFPEVEQFYNLIANKYSYDKEYGSNLNDEKFTEASDTKLHEYAKEIFTDKENNFSFKREIIDDIKLYAFVKNRKKAICGKILKKLLIDDPSDLFKILYKSESIKKNANSLYERANNLKTTK